MVQQVKTPARIAPLPIEHSPELREHFEAMRRNLGFVPNSILIMQRTPKPIAVGGKYLAAHGWSAGKHAR